MDKSRPNALSNEEPRSSPCVRILLADDYALLRDGLRKLLEPEPDFSVIGVAGSNKEAVNLTCQLKPDVLLLSLDMADEAGLEVLTEVTASAPHVRSIVLAAFAEKNNIVKAVQLGARGVLMKTSSAERLFQAIRGVMDGQYVLGSQSISDLVEAIRDKLPPLPSDMPWKQFGLTPRERDIAEAIIAGHTNKDISHEFSLSEHTVKHHVTSIFNKLHVADRFELALFATQHKLLCSP